MVSSLRFVEVAPQVPEQTLAQAVLEGLSGQRKSLPCRFFYDDAGSAFFERICQLPEYYPTRTERALLERHADEVMEAAATGTAAREPLSLVELGSGSGYKTRLLIEAALRRQERLHYVPIDISGEFLRESSHTLMAEYPNLAVTALAAEYRDALRLLPSAEGPRLFLFLGSNIGNFDTGEAVQLLADLRIQMAAQDRLLIGVDLVKSREVLAAAYNDSAGVTEAFNKNLLVRINREMGADFDPDLWEHRALWVESKSRIEMWLVSSCDQVVTLPEQVPGEGAHHFAFRRGEGIHTENSHKYTPKAFERLCRAAGLGIRKSWMDDRNWFGAFLLEPAEGDTA